MPTNLYVLRLERGQSLRDLADELDVHFQSLSRWERGTSQPRPDNGKKLREGLGLPLSLLLSLNKERP
jgi:transcriptional regulator with XRE-family HTH domain